MAIIGCASRLLMRALIAAGIGVFGSTAALAAGDVSPKSWAYRISTGTGTNDLFPTAAQACQKVFPEDKFLRAATDSENRVQCFFRHAKDGYDYDTNAVSRVAVCPENARSEDSGSTCTCEDTFEASGGKCVASGARPAATQASAAGAIATPPPAPLSQDECHLGQEMTNEREAHLKKWMGKPISQVPELASHWAVAVKQQQLAEVAALRPNEKTNDTNRRKYFGPTRDRFWALVAADETAKTMLLRSGAYFRTAGRAPWVTLLERSEELNVDHHIPLAVDPTKMLDASNLRLITRTENTATLRRIDSLDPFQSPESAARWIQKQKGMKKCKRA